MIKKIFFLIVYFSYIYGNDIEFDTKVEYKKNYYETQDSTYLNNLDTTSESFKINIDVHYEYAEHLMQLNFTDLYDITNKENSLYLNSAEYNINNFTLAKKNVNIGNSLLYKPLKNIFNYSTYDDYGIWQLSYNKDIDLSSYKFVVIPKVSYDEDKIFYQHNNMLGIFNNNIFNTLEFNFLYFYSDGYDYNQKFNSHHIFSLYNNLPIKNTDLITYIDFLIKSYDNNKNIKTLLGFNYPFGNDYKLNVEFYYNDNNINIYEDTNKDDYQYSNNKYFSLGYSLFKENLFQNIDLTLFNDYNTYKKMLKTGIHLSYIKSQWKFLFQLENTKLYRDTTEFDKSNVYKNNLSFSINYKF